MKFRLKSMIKSVLPQFLINTLRSLRSSLLDLPQTLERRRTQRIFEAATDTPSYLDISALEKLQMEYPPLPEYGYDAHTREARGISRATQILGLPGAQGAHSFLELGCGDGMVSCCLCRKGKKATAIDLGTGLGFDARASREGVCLIQMDAAELRFEDESFDFVFSYDGFEHFASPEDVLRAAIRVLKKGGYLYLRFGPLYYSPFGEHAYRSITVPYCQFLFPKGFINDFTTQKGLDPIDFSYVNNWALESYRQLWDKSSKVLKRVKYDETLNLSHLSLIRKYPSCFKSKSNYFENFIVSGLSVLFQKTAHESLDNWMDSNTRS